MKQVRKFGLIGAFFCLSLTSNAQFVTIGAGDWNNPSIWNLGSVPTSTAGSITINHFVTIPAGFSVNADEVVINSLLIISNGGTFSIVDGIGDDLTMSPGSFILVNGEFIRNDLTTINQTGSMNFGSGSFYRHRFTKTEGILPTAYWDNASTVSIEGFNNTTALDLMSSSWNQSFGNFLYNCTGQKGIVNFNGLIKTVDGDATFQSTGNNITKLTDTESNVAINILGTLSITGTSRVNFTDSGTGNIVGIAGNFNFTSTNTGATYLATTGTLAINLTGDFSMNAGGGRLYFASSAGGTGNTTLNLANNFTLTSGIISELGSGGANGNLHFVGNGNAIFFNSGSITNHINYLIDPAKTLDVGTSPVTAGAGSSFVVNGTIVLGSLEPTGALRNSTTVGNIRTPFSLRVYATGSNIIYRGISAQIIGDGQPGGIGINTIIDNTANVTLYQGGATTFTSNGNLILQSGILFIGAKTLNLNGTVSYASGRFGGNSSSILAVGGTTGGNVDLMFDPSNNVLNTLTINRTGTSAGSTVNAALIVAAKLNLTNGVLHNAAGLTAGNNCIVTRFPTSSLLDNSLSFAPNDFFDVLYRTSVHANFATGLELPQIANASGLRNVTFSPTLTTDSIRLSQNVFLNGNMTFNKGLVLASNHNVTLKANWVDGSGNFDIGSGTVIFDGVSTVSGTSNTTFNNLQVNAGKSLTIARSFNVKGNIDFKPTSTFNHGLFAITLNGSALQTISGNGNSFFNVVVTKTGGNIQLTSNLNLINLLRFNTPAANCNFQSNGFLTLISTSDAVGTASAPGTAQIYRLAGGNTVSGDVTVQRYMSGEGRIYRYISSPVTNATIASWKDDFSITGNFSDPSPATTICGTKIIPKNPSLYIYNENVVGNVDAGYVAYPISGLASASPLVPAKGYVAFIRECNNPTVIDVTGPINMGTITVPVTYTNTGDPSADGYNLVGNPYPCTIDWDLGLTKTRISTVVSIRDNASGMMLYWDGSTGTIPNGQIAPGQAFWIRATAANPIFRISENSKNITPAQGGEFFRQIQSDGVMTIALSDGKMTDRAFVKIQSDSAENVIDKWDAPKLDNDLFDLYTLSSDSVSMAINVMKSVDCSSILSLGTKDLMAGSYTLALENIEGEFNSYSYTLFDTYTGTRTNFSDSYTFVVDTNPLSSNRGRFRVEFSQKMSPVITLENTSTLRVSAGSDIQWYFNNLPVKGGNNATLEASEGGVYAVHIKIGSCNTVATYDFIAIERITSNVSKVYPNPTHRFIYVDADPDKIQFDNISIFDNLGKQKGVKSEIVNGKLQLDLELYTSGIYYLSFYENGVLNNFKLIKN